MKKIFMLFSLVFWLLFVAGCSLIQQEVSNDLVVDEQILKLQQHASGVALEIENFKIQNELLTKENELLKTQIDVSSFDKEEKWLLYSNTEYGFSLTFPQSWESYITQERMLDWGTFGTSNSIDFGFSAQDSLFNISFHPKEQWQKMAKDGELLPTYLWENQEYVFVYAFAQDTIDDTMTKRYEEMPDIIKTFKL